MVIEESDNEGGNESIDNRVEIMRECDPPKPGRFID
jgi:hypothetical protein